MWVDVRVDRLYQTENRTTLACYRATGWLEAQNETKPRFHPSNNEKDSTTDAAGTTTSTHEAATKIGGAVGYGFACVCCVRVI